MIDRDDNSFSLLMASEQGEKSIKDSASRTKIIKKLIRPKGYQEKTQIKYPLQQQQSQELVAVTKRKDSALQQLGDYDGRHL
jgi:hypothetical protein